MRVVNYPFAIAWIAAAPNGLDVIASIGEPDETVAKMDALHRESRGDDRDQVGAMHGQVRRAP